MGTEGQHKTVSFRDAVVVSVPSRVAVSVFDMNMFSRGSAGGGNSGVALSIYTKLRLTRKVLPSDVSELNPDQDLLFQHCKTVWADRVCDPGDISPRVIDSPPSHVGLSSSSTFQVAAYNGLNWLSGSPLSDHELLQLMHSNYREIENGRLVGGFATGLAAFLGMYGGFGAVDVDLKPLRRHTMPEWVFYVVLPRVGGKSNYGNTEADILMGDGRARDLKDREKKRELIETALFPSAQNGDLNSFGEAVMEIQSLGNKRAQIQGQDPQVDVALKGLRNYGLRCVFMSSLGPGIVILNETPIEDITEILDEFSLRQVFSGNIDNIGLRLETET